MKPKVSILLLLALAVFFKPHVHADELTIYTEEWRPISFSSHGKPAGLGVAVVQEILARLNMPDNIKVVPWERGWREAREKPNVVLFTMTLTKEREKLFKLIGPVAIGKTNLYAKKGSGINIESLEDAKHFGTIGVYKDSYEEQFLKEHGFTNLDSSPYPLEAAKKLINGRVKLWANANLTVGGILMEGQYSLDLVEEVFTLSSNHLYIAFSKGTPDEMVGKWQNALEDMKKDGAFARIYSKWLPGEVPPVTIERRGL